MLEIKPIQDKDLQKQYADACAIPYDPDCLAYAAKEDGVFVGMTQFNIEKRQGYLKNITLLPHTDDFEALFLMGRATLNFLDLAGIHSAYCDKDTASPRVLAAVGFVLGDDGVYRADMTHMFGGCGEHK